MIYLRSHATGDLLACERRYELSTVLGLRPTIEAPHFKWGTTWHKLHELIPGPIDDDGIESIIEVLNAAYQTEAELETREIILRQFIGYKICWGEDVPTITQTEVEFECPIPGTDIVLAGRLDALGEYEDEPLVIERKTTSEKLDAASDYWTRLRDDIQISLYTLVTGRPVWYDVIRKPSIKQTQKETLEEYGDRLLADMQERPEFYLGRRIVARPENDKTRFTENLRRLGERVRWLEQTGSYSFNPGACKVPGRKCTYFDLCFGPTPNWTATDGEPPLGYKFVNLTVSGGIR